jgi:hypothetical protein
MNAQQAFEEWFKCERNPPGWTMPSKFIAEANLCMVNGEYTHEQTKTLWHAWRACWAWAVVPARKQLQDTIASRQVVIENYNKMVREHGL